jgi:hypothetical protein
MKVNSDPLPQEANYMEPVTFEINMVDISNANIPTNVNYIFDQYD